MIEKIVFVSVSGGKDSTLCLALALEKYSGTDVPVVAVFADTKWEHPLTYEYLDELEKFFGIRIHRVGRPGGIPRLLRERKIFPSPRRRFCTSECKTVPVHNFYLSVYFSFPFKTAEVWYGMRVWESVRRRNVKDWVLKAGEKTRFGESFPFDIRFCYPIKYLRSYEVFGELYRRGIPINPLYKMGFKRVGCYPCFISATDICQVASANDDFSKSRIKEIEQLEEEFGRTVHVDFSIREVKKRRKTQPSLF